MERYAENTVSSIYYLILEAQDIKDVNTDHFASHLGKAHGITNLIRSVPYNAKKRKLVLPQDILMKHNVSSESIFQEKTSKEMKDVIFDVSSRAKQHLDKVSINSFLFQNLKIYFKKLILHLFFSGIVY